MRTDLSASTMTSFFAYPGGDAERADPAFLAGATGEEWQILVREIGAHAFEAGEDLIAAGDPGDAFYILIEGRVQVVAPALFGTRIVATIEAGSVFGEIAFLDGGTRTATVRAITGGTMMRLTRAGLDALQERDPALATRIALDLGRICAARLRRTLRLLDR